MAWLAELFPEPVLRETVLGYSQAFSATAGFILSAAYYLAVTFGSQLPEIRGHHSGWRYVLLLGLFPAIPLLIVRPFLPESPLWQRRKQEGSLQRPSFAELFHPELRRATVISTVMVACSYAAAFGAIQHIPRIIPGLADVQRLSLLRQEQIISTSHLYSDFGQVVGRLSFAVLAGLLIRPRYLLYTFLLPCLVVFPFVFFYAGQHDLATLRWGYFAASALMTAQLSYWGNYLPRLYPLHLRGTGESFASNVGGRILGNGAAVLTAHLATTVPGSGASARLSLAAGIVSISAYLIALAASFSLPTPRRDLTQ